MTDKTIDDLAKEQPGLHSKVNDLIGGQHEILAAIADLTSHQYGFDSKLNSLDQGLGELKEYTYAGFDTMNDRFDRLEDQVDRLSAELGPGGYQR
jgi:uncharacterized phage infection (PIP) family protein YhgE